MFRNNLTRALLFEVVFHPKATGFYRTYGFFKTLGKVLALEN